MGDDVLPAVGLGAGKGDLFDDARDDGAEDVQGGGGEVKETPIDDSTSDLSRPHAVSSLTTDASKVRAHSVPGAGAGAYSVRGACAPVASLVLWALSVISSKLTRARAAFLVLTLLALWRSAGEPWRSVWTFTLITIFYLGMWAIYLTAAVHPLTVLVSLSYLVLLAISVTHLSYAAGVFIILLDMAYAAGLFGYALAEYRQRKGMERSAVALQTLMKQEELQDNKAVITMVSLYAVIASFVSVAGALWVVVYTVDMYWVVVLLSLLIDLSLFYWTALVAIHLLHSVLLEEDHMAFIFWGTALLFLPDSLLTYLFGEAIGVLVHPIGVMGMAGVLGYTLSVHVCYQRFGTQ